MHSLNRRKFIFQSAAAGIGLGLMNHLPALARPALARPALAKPSEGKRVGIIGLDTSHAIAFTKG
jgi:hypothetical protein